MTSRILSGVAKPSDPVTKVIYRQFEKVFVTPICTCIPGNIQTPLNLWSNSVCIRCISECPAVMFALIQLLDMDSNEFCPMESDFTHM